MGENDNDSTSRPPYNTSIYLVQSAPCRLADMTKSQTSVAVILGRAGTASLDSETPRTALTRGGKVISVWVRGAPLILVRGALAGTRLVGSGSELCFVSLGIRWLGADGVFEWSHLEDDGGV